MFMKTEFVLRSQSINQIPNLSTVAKTKELSKDYQRQDFRPTTGWNGLQVHRQAAWWEGDNGWYDYSPNGRNTK